MELICLDTSVLINHRRIKDKSQSLLYKLAGTYSFALTTVTVFEIWRGDNSDEDEYWLQLFSKMTVLDFDTEAAKIAGKIYLDLKKTGQMIGIEDILIGAIALSNNLTVATTNKKHFERINNLEILD